MWMVEALHLLAALYVPVGLYKHANGILMAMAILACGLVSICHLTKRPQTMPVNTFSLSFLVGGVGTAVVGLEDPHDLK